MPDEADNAVAETALIRAVQAGDVEAFARLLDLHLPQVRTFLALRAPIAQLVDEVAHDTFVFAFRHIGEFQPGTAFRAWLRAVAWNLLRAEVQRFARERANLDRFTALQLADWREDTAASDAVPEAEHLQACLEKLDGSLRELVQLKYRDEHSTETIARRLERSLVWVRVSLFRVRKQLRACIEARMGRRLPC